MKNKNLNIWSWVVFILFCSICIYDIVVIDNGHFDRMGMANLRFLEGILFAVSVFLLIMQINFEKLREAVLIVSLLCIALIVFVGSLVWETHPTEDPDFQEPNKFMEIIHILVFLSFFVLKIYVSFKNMKKLNEKI